MVFMYYRRKDIPFLQNIGQCYNMFSMRTTITNFNVIIQLNWLRKGTVTSCNSVINLSVLKIKVKLKNF